MSGSTETEWISLLLKKKKTSVLMTQRSVISLSNPGRQILWIVELTSPFYLASRLSLPQRDGCHLRYNINYIFDWRRLLFYHCHGSLEYQLGYSHWHEKQHANKTHICWRNFSWTVSSTPVVLFIQQKVERDWPDTQTHYYCTCSWTLWSTRLSLR